MHKVIIATFFIVLLWLAATGIGLPWLFNQNSWLAMLAFAVAFFVGLYVTYFFIIWAIAQVKKEFKHHE
jgi:hypothetical protein